MSGTQDYDPRIVDLYDGDNPDGPDHDYYRSLAAALDARRILDVGCGTGMLTVTLVAPGRRVVGVDPSSSMLAYARCRPGAERVRWVEGDTRALSGDEFDLVVMTGNVAQHIPDPHWQRSLRDVRRLASPNTTLAFESRNPSARAWEAWSQEAPSTRPTMYGPLREWYEVEERGGGCVLLRAFNHFENTGETVVDERLLTFRSQEELAAQLSDAGFEVTAVWGGWSRTPFDGSQPLMIFEARAGGLSRRRVWR